MHRPSRAATQRRPADEILDVVVDLIETGGYDAVQLREVARRARVSLATVYRLHPTRDDLIVSGVERWMAANCYNELLPPEPGESLHDGLMRVMGYVFEPWERSPRMLEAYHRANRGPGGERLDRQGMNAIEPVARAVLAGADPGYVRDIELVLVNLTYALVGRFADGVLGITEIMPALERAVFRITADNAAAAAEAVTPAGTNADPTT